MDINEIKAWAFDKQVQLEQTQQTLQQMNNALMQIAVLVGLPQGETSLQTLVDTVGAKLAEKQG